MKSGDRVPDVGNRAVGQNENFNFSILPLHFLVAQTDYADLMPPPSQSVCQRVNEGADAAVRQWWIFATNKSNVQDLLDSRIVCRGNYGSAQAVAISKYLC